MLCSVENWESHWHGWWARVGGEGLWLERGFFLVSHYLIRENYWIYRVSQRTPSLAAKILVSHPLLGALPLGCEASVLLGNLWLDQFRMVLWYGLSYLSFFLLGISVCSPENISLFPETVQAPRATQSATNPKLATGEENDLGTWEPDVSFPQCMERKGRHWTDCGSRCEETGCTWEFAIWSTLFADLSKNLKKKTIYPVLELS